MMTNIPTNKLWLLLAVAIDVATSQNTRSHSPSNDDLFDIVMELQARLAATEFVNSQLQLKIIQLESKHLHSYLINK